MRDVSERKKMDDQSRDLYQQLVQAEKMAALGQTISGVAHELNNPLATMLTWSERLAQKPLDEGTKRGIEIILHEAERAAKIVRQLLTFARKRQSTRTMVDLNQIVRETLALRAYEQRVTNVAVIDALASGLPQIFADPHQIQQVLLNLVINAEQAMLTANGRGTLVVRTWHDATREAVLLEINDDGPGVPPDVQGEDLRSLLHHEGSRQGHGPGPDGRLRDRPGARRPDPHRAGGPRRVVRRGAARDAGNAARIGGGADGGGAEEARGPARARRGRRSRARERPSPTRSRTRDLWSIVRGMEKRRSRRCASALTIW